MSAFPYLVSEIATGPRQPVGVDAQAIQHNALGLQQGQQGLAIGREQQHALELENQQRDMDLKSQQAIMRGYTEAGGDLDKTLPLAAKYGAKPGDLLKLRAASFEMQKQNMELLNMKGARALTEADLMQGAHDSVASLPPEQRSAAWAQQLQHLQGAGIDVSQISPQYPGDEAFQMMGLQLKGHKQQLEDLAKQSGILETQQKTATGAAQEKEAGAKTAEALATTDKLQAETGFLKQYGGLSPAMAESRYLFTQQRMKQGIPVSPADAAFSKAYEKNKTLNATTTFNLQGGGTRYDLNDPTVQAVAEGRLKIADVMTMRTPYPVRKQFLEAVQQVNPQFDSRNYDVEKGVMKDFTSGNAAKNLTAFNTAIEHANQLVEATKDLKNFDNRTLNKLAQAYGVEMGNDNVGNFNVIKNALAGEISKVFKGGQATDAEISNVVGPFNSANSPAQLKGAVQAAVALMNSKRDALKQQYEAGMQAKPTFGTSGALPNGGGKAIDKDTALQFYKAAGGDPEKARQLAIQNGWKVQ